MSISALFAFLILLFSPRLYAGGEIGVKLDKLSKTLVSGYETSFSGTERVSLAVLPFHTDKELAKRRTGIALAELLIHSFRQYEKFKIIERMELNQIFEELKLNMSGVVDAEEALKIGRLGGAKLQIFGSMEKIGGRYHINARIVETESGEVFATAYETLPAGLFEEEAKSYLAPVPETQALGFYFLYNFRDVPTASGPYS